jgi:hypothetical protein
LDLSAFGFLSLPFEMAILLLECVSGRHDHDGQSGEADQHPYSEASKSIYALSPGGWIERSEEEAVVAFGQLRFDCCAREIPTNGHSDYGTAAELSPTASNPTARRC